MANITNRMAKEYDVPSIHEGLLTMSEPQNKAFAGVGKPMNEVVCLSSRLNFAGAMARRIVTYAKEGEDCYIDEHLGFIKLGSRVDVFLPIGTEVCVKMGQTTTGDQTIIAKLK